MREFGSGSRRVVERALHAAGLKSRQLNISMEFDSTEALLSAVEAGLGVTFVSRWAVRNQLSLGTLRVARVRGLQLSRMFSMAYGAGPAPAGNVGAFRQFLLARASDLAPRPTGKAAAIAPSPRCPLAHCPEENVRAPAVPASAPLRRVPALLSGREGQAMVYTISPRSGSALFRLRTLSADPARIPSCGDPLE